MSSAYFTLIIFRNSDHSTNPLPRSVTDVPPVCGPLGGVREERPGRVSPAGNSQHKVRRLSRLRAHTEQGQGAQEEQSSHWGMDFIYYFLGEPRIL